MITIYDTATGSLNIGDSIIMDAAMSQLEGMFSNKHFVLYPTHYSLARSTLKKAWKNDLGFVCGTNLLRNHWRWRARKNQWALSFLDSFKMQPAILFGVGWNTYGDNIEWKAQSFYKRSLRKDVIHSVRDSYTEKKLRSFGLTNVINTGCPTLWSLTDEKIANIPCNKSSSVVFTLTDYRKDNSMDIAFIKTLTKNYKNIYFWPQGSGDLTYFKELINNITIEKNIETLPSNLSAFNKILNEHDIDYIGTRLHAGIRALQLYKRSIIIGVDNRAIEMKEDINLPVVNRESIEELNHIINNTLPLSLNIPWGKIKEWKSQFNKKPQEITL